MGLVGDQVREGRLISWENFVWSEIVFDKCYLQVEVCGERFLKGAFPAKAVKQNAKLTLMILTRQNISDVD